jgi:Tfp pilus assembly protein PilN
MLLPRGEVIVRTLALPGVSDRDVASAIELQIETLHPYGDEEVVWAWSRIGPETVLAGIVRKPVIASWETLFGEAGIPLAAITFSPAAVHAALRIWNTDSPSVLCFSTDEHGRTEIYGESEARPLYSAELSFSLERALSIARAELRLAPEHPGNTLGEMLPRPVNGNVSVSPLAWAAALAGSGPRAARFANLLPPERRASHARVQYLLPALLGFLLLASLPVVFIVLPAIQQSRYRKDLARAAASLQPSVLRVQNLERSIRSNRDKIAALDEFRRRPQADLDVLAELTRLLPPPAWTTAIEIYPDSVVISGEADQAAPLLKVLDSSPLFQNSEFVSSVNRNGTTEQFRIKTMRRGRIGRTTP